MFKSDCTRWYGQNFLRYGFGRPARPRRRAADLVRTAWIDTLENRLLLASTTVEVRVNHAADDAEEASDREMDLESSDLEMVRESSQQTIGVRFNSVAIPRGAIITNAYVQFQTDETGSSATSLVIQGEKSGNSTRFTDRDGNISSRPLTNTAVSWNPAPWSKKGEAGPNQRTPDIRGVIQEIVNQSSWSSGNALTLIITGSGKRVAEAYDGDSSGAPLLHVEYTLDQNDPTPPQSEPQQDENNPPQDQNDPPVVTSATFSLEENSGNGTTVGTVTANDPEGHGITFSLTGGNTNNAFAIHPTTGVVTVNNTAAIDFESTPQFRLTVTATDNGPGNRAGSATVTVNLIDEDETPVGSTTTVEVRVSASSDDAEEASNGSMDLNSSDLEMVTESSQQTVGLRFNGVSIPRGAIITNAYLQFKTDETGSGSTSLLIQGHKTGNAPTFTSSSRNISSRTRTTAAVPWNPAAWTSRGASGPSQRSSNIQSVIQEIVNQSSWSSGNALVLIITGNGKRVAEAYDGDRAGAPLLHVEYIVNGNNPIPGDLPSQNPPDDNPPANNPPVALDSTVSLMENSDYRFQVNDFRFNDPEGHALASVTITNQKLGGGTLRYSGGTVSNGQTLTAAQLATLVYTPPKNQSGRPLATFDFRVNDSSSGTVWASMEVDVLPQPAATPIYRVNAGGGQLAGTLAWSEDSQANPSPFHTTGSSVYSYSHEIDLSHSSIPAGTPQALFQSERWDSPTGNAFLWSFPVIPGDYEVRLYFAEIWTGAHTVGARVFDVSIEGVQVLDNYDVFAKVGPWAGVMESFVVTSDGSLDIEFGHVVQHPSVKGIEILALTEGQVPPPPPQTQPQPQPEPEPEPQPQPQPQPQPPVSGASIIVALDGSGHYTKVEDALAAAKGGETILVKAGNHGALHLYGPRFANGLQFSSPVTIKSYDSNNRAVFNHMIFDSVRGINIDSINIRVIQDPTWRLSGIYIGSGSSDFVIRNCDIYGNSIPGDPNMVNYKAIQIRGGSNVLIENNVLHNSTYGVHAHENSHFITVRGNYFHDNLIDNMQMGNDISNIVIEYNYFNGTDPINVANRHNDNIQFHTAGATTPTRNVIIRGNTIIQNVGWSQSIFIRNESGVGLINFQIYDNLIVNAHLHGISIHGVTGASIHHNTVVWSGYDPGFSWNKPQILAYGTDIEVAYNVVMDLDLDAGVNAHHNVIVQKDNSSGSNHYTDAFVNGNVSNTQAQARDFAPRPGGILDLGGGNYIGASPR